MKQFWGSWGGLGGSWGVLGRGLGGFWLPGAAWEASGTLVGDFGGLDGPNLGPKMASSWGLDRTKIDANIARISDAFENRNLDGKSRFLNRKIMFLGLHLG